MKKIQNSIVLKAVCYILMPLLFLNIIINTFSVIYYDEYKDDIKSGITYFETERFAESYIRNIYSKLDIVRIQRTHNAEKIIEDTENSSEEIKKEQENALIYERENGINYEYTSQNTYKYLIIDDTGAAHTNIAKTVNTDTIEELKDYIKSKKYFWNYDNDEINTNIEKMKYENIAYNGSFERIEKVGYTVYSCINNENSAEFYKYNLVYKIVSNTYEYASVNIAISSFLLVSMFIYIITSIGHKKGEEGIYLNSLDRIPLEILGTISIILLEIEWYCLFAGMNVRHRLYKYKQ